MTTTNYYQDVGDFHRKFDIPDFDPRKPCEFPDPEIVQYRVKFIEEELNELKKAISENNLVDVMDALADLTYVSLGTAHYFNAPFPQIWREVQRANLSRIKVTLENCPPEKQYRPDMVIKPPDWKPPRIETLIERHNKFASRWHRLWRNR